jgi:hypothetical protein
MPQSRSGGIFQHSVADSIVWPPEMTFTADRAPILMPLTFQVQASSPLYKRAEQGARPNFFSRLIFCFWILDDSPPPFHGPKANAASSCLRDEWLASQGPEPSKVEARLRLNAQAQDIQSSHVNNASHATTRDMSQQVSLCAFHEFFKITPGKQKFLPHSWCTCACRISFTSGRRCCQCFRLQLTRHQI